MILVRPLPLLAAVAALAFGAACGGASRIDADRQHALGRDPLGVRNAPETTPWVPPDDSRDSYGDVGRGDGIGFGGVSPTTAWKARHMQGSPADTLRFYAEVAIRSGWRISQIRCDATSDSFGASKQFPGWVASAVVGAGNVFKGAPAVSINLETDWHGEATEKTLPRLAVHWLTVDDLASTCVGTKPAD